MERKNWTREELIVAFNLYCKIPFGQIHHNNPQIIHLANLLGRTPSAISFKLSNFARLDPDLQKRGIGGMAHGSKLDEHIWNEFYQNWDALTFESEKLLAQLEGRSFEDLLIEETIEKQGLDTERLIRVRVNQNFFRSTILANYNFRCAITGLAIPKLLVASHIIPWSIDKNNRLNPHNGMCLNAFHDRAFDNGLLTISPEYKVRISSSM